jgi:hypothetical protein
MFWRSVRIYRIGCGLYDVAGGDRWVVASATLSHREVLIAEMQSRTLSVAEGWLG